MQFCPTCANLLLISTASSSQSRFYCPTCPYVAPLSTTHRRRHQLPRKQVDDVLGGADAWKNVDSTEAECGKCGEKRAYFMQIQTRSADEPMTTFYKCANHSCGYQWKEN